MESDQARKFTGSERENEISEEVNAHTSEIKTRIQHTAKILYRKIQRKYRRNITGVYPGYDQTSSLGKTQVMLDRRHQ